jgi:SAM-dependent methyltransferase
MNLVYCSRDSYGIEFRGARARFAKSLGLNVFECNFLVDDLSHLPRVDVVWCAATLEHVDAPHVLLRRLYNLLKGDGRIILETPCAIPNRMMWSVPFLNRVFGDHDDHINSFSQTSLIRFCERAGFAEEWSFRYSTPLVMRRLPVRVTGIFPFSIVAQSVVYVGRRIPGWNYPPKATRNAADNALGYEFRDQILGPAECIVGDQQEKRTSSAAGSPALLDVS